MKDARDSIADVIGTFQQSASSFFEAMSGSGISYNECSTDTGIPAWGKVSLGITGAVSRYAKNAEGFVSKGSISKTGYGAESGSFSKGVGNPVEVVGRGSTGRTVPNTLNEQMAMHQVMSNPLEGTVDMSQLKNHPVIMSDSRWLASEGWVKMSNNVNGVEIHFVYNKITGEFDDFKYK